MSASLRTSTPGTLAWQPAGVALARRRLGSWAAGLRCLAWLLACCAWPQGPWVAALPGSGSVTDGPGAEPTGDLGALGARVEPSPSARARLTGTGPGEVGWPRPRERAATGPQQLHPARWSTVAERIHPAGAAADSSVGAWLECAELNLRMALQPETRADLARLYEHRLVAHWPAADAGPGAAWVGLRLAVEGCPSSGLWLGQAIEAAGSAASRETQAPSPSTLGTERVPELRSVEFRFNLPSVFEPGQRYHLELWRLASDGLLERVTQQPLRIVDVWAWDLDPLPGPEALPGASTTRAQLPGGAGGSTGEASALGSTGDLGMEPTHLNAAKPQPPQALVPGNSVSVGPRWQARVDGELATGPAGAALAAPLEFMLRLRLAGLTPLARFEARLWLQSRRPCAPSAGQNWPAGALRVRTPGGPDPEDLGPAFGPTPGGGDELQAALVLGGNAAGHAWLELHGDLAWARWPCRLLVWVEPQAAGN